MKINQTIFFLHIHKKKNHSNENTISVVSLFKRVVTLLFIGHDLCWFSDMTKCQPLNECIYCSHHSQLFTIVGLKCYEWQMIIYSHREPRLKKKKENVCNELNWIREIIIIIYKKKGICHWQTNIGFSSLPVNPIKNCQKINNFSFSYLFVCFIQK